MGFNEYTFVIWSVVLMSAVVNAAVNLATGDVVTNQSSTYTIITGWVSSKAVDGCTSQMIATSCCTHTDVGHKEVWWQVDLRQQSVIERVKILYRHEDLTLTRLGGFEIYLSDTSDWRSGVRCYQDNTASLALMTATQDVPCVGIGRYVTIYSNRTVKARTWYWDDAFLELCEVYVFGCPSGKFGNGHCNDDCLNCNTCLPTSGECYCNDGYYGPTCLPCSTGCLTNTCDTISGNCNHCDVGFYSDHCDQNCPSNCKNNVCNKVNGQCAECDVGFFGNHCDQTCPGNCENRTCNKDSGVCIDCNDGYYGPTCTPCPTGCSANTCDITSGNCLHCDSGFFGNRCDKPCPENCKNNMCHKDNGLCTVPLSEKQTGNSTGLTTEWYIGFAVLGIALGISV
ncbi:scavenger receptor class F member 2-like isoform X2 [Argopecten irradians]|uniref:scavenger receptor class F member 2-like isoform X2 n=1 Tax=Argopecten irradians TaxID=31199 RepID=UPI00371A9A03